MSDGTFGAAFNVMKRRDSDPTTEVVVGPGAGVAAGTVVVVVLVLVVVVVVVRLTVTPPGPTPSGPLGVLFSQATIKATQDKGGQEQFAHLDPSLSNRTASGTTSGEIHGRH